MPTCVLDACAVLAYLNDEAGADVVERLLTSEDEITLLHAVNYVEIHYISVRRLGTTGAEGVERDIQDLGITVRRDMDVDICRAAAEMRVIVLDAERGGRGSLADSFCAALAEREECRVVTSDGKDFEPIERAGRCTIDTFR